MQRETTSATGASAIWCWKLVRCSRHCQTCNCNNHNKNFRKLVMSLESFVSSTTHIPCPKSLCILFVWKMFNWKWSSELAICWKSEMTIWKPLEVWGRSGNGALSLSALENFVIVAQKYRYLNFRPILIKIIALENGIETSSAKTCLPGCILVNVPGYVEGG